MAPFGGSPTCPFEGLIEISLRLCRRSLNFRFDQIVEKEPSDKKEQEDENEEKQYLINEFDQIWCFAIEPAYFTGENGETTLSESELAVLAKWMGENQGGLLAMGDHDELGAAMCSKIPRVSTMRYWLRDKNRKFTVPPAEGRLRYDTNQPATPRAISF